MSDSENPRHYADPESPGNGQEYRTNRLCITPRCPNEAGTYWSHLWCMPCNIKRMDSINASFKRMQERLSAP